MSRPSYLALAPLLAPLLALAGAAGDVHAGGTSLPGYGSQAMPRAGAFVAKADDPSAIFHNPAGLAKIRGTVLYLGINLVNFRQSFQREGSYEECTDAKCPSGGLPYAGQPYPKVENTSHGQIPIGNFATVPLLAVASDLGLDLPLTFGAGIFAPGAGSADREFAKGYIPEQDPSQPPPPNRYDVLKQQASVLFPSLAVGYAPNSKWSVGARASWGFASIASTTSLWGVRNYEEWEGFDAHVRLKTKDNFVPAFGAGALYTPHSNWELGFNYRSASKVRSKGTVLSVPGSGTLINGMSALEPTTEGPFKCGAGSIVGRLVACINLNQPQIASLGGRYIVRDKAGDERADIELDVQWENWSNASVTESIVEAKTVTLPMGLPGSSIRNGFKDVFSIRLGGSYTMPLKTTQIQFRAGLAHDTETAEESWTRVNQDSFARTTASAGVGVDWDRYRFELSGGFVYEGTRTVSHDGCNPTNDNIGCDGTNTETPLEERDAPDPGQPITDDPFIVQSPFNAGIYKQGYILLGLGVSAKF